MAFFLKKRATLPVPEELAKQLRHIAFIMDGNGRWAKRRGLPRTAGHIQGAKNFQKVLEHCGDIGIRTVTVYAFSTENWSRSEEEVSALMQLFNQYMDIGFRNCVEKDIRVIFLGDKSRYPAVLREKAEKLEADTASCHLVLNIALNYGSRAEILQAVNRCLQEGRASVTEEEFTEHLYTALSPDPDLVVRTGGDLRISNFLLWQSAYAEYFFTDTLWPDLSAKEIDSIVCNFLGRQRRYGNVK